MVSFSLSRSNFSISRGFSETLTGFAVTLERICVETVESGKMTKDLALLIGPDQPWLTTEGFLAALDENLAAAIAG